ncbi:splicing factor Cactin [Bacillus rossius redtenbacheri]|uniref:splicing factor Cactin n=1 Tax=Bacillus rossius redtenbacheri TaxID=93214 RepID=UPI002FDE1DF5
MLGSPYRNDRSHSGSRSVKSKASKQCYKSSEDSDSGDEVQKEKRKSRESSSPSSPPPTRKSKHKKEKRSSSTSSTTHKSKHKKKKKGRRPESPGSGSGEDSDGSVKLLRKLQQERLRRLEERRRQKELLKATETPEEKRLRRLLKKEAKERKRKERMGWDNDYLHYTNTDNPFGDGNLLATFVWSKKLDKEGLTGASRDELEIRNRQKQEENRRELEKVKKRRQERELERQQREDEMALMQRGKEAAQFQEWERQEDQFHLEQARLRSRIRIQDGRAKPIDLLAKYISAEEEVDAVEMHEPYTYLNGLTIKDLEDLIEDIKVYKELERGKNLDYWNDITVIVEDELHKLRKLEKQSAYEEAVGRREGIHQSVAKDVAAVFKGKTAAQLEAMQLKIETKINGKPEGVDIGYWESLLSQLKAHMARARLRDRHQENLRRKLEVLKAQQGVAASARLPGDAPREEGQAAGQSDEVASTSSEEEEGEGEEEEEEESQGDQAARAMLTESFADYESGGYSPQYLASSQLDPGTLITAEEDDLQRLEFARKQVQGTGSRVENVVAAEEQALLREAKKGMTGEEAEFSVEQALDNQVYLWSDKYRPRKPRYFNRVHTGFEWNKYNQTHYDMDNPPPKIVQGYKFNIFYPDLIDKGTTPEYFLTPCPDNRDFAILRFHAGPPYEDIAFKIVNREWEYSYKRGFRCQFHNNIFQLWFHFKRYRYRR